MIITGEPTRIRIYRETHHARGRFVLTHYDCFGQRQRRAFGTFEEAESEASTLKKEFKGGGWDLITLRGTERLAYQRATEMLRPLCIPLDHAVLKLVEAVQGRPRRRSLECKMRETNDNFSAARKSKWRKNTISSAYENGTPKEAEWLR